MSVLKNERRTSVHQFKVNYFGIKEDIDIIVSKISNRRKKFIPYELNKTLYDFQHVLTMMDTQQRYANADIRVQNCKDAINLLYTLPKYIFRTLMLCEAEIGSNFVTELESKLNNEAMLLYEKLGKEGINVARRRIRLYDRRKIQGVTYLEKLQKLYRMTMAKIIHLQNKYFSLIEDPLYISITNAFYYAYKANSVFPDTIVNIKKRREHLNHALAYLESYEHELFNLFVYIDYEDDVIGAFSKNLVECNKLLKSIIKSDTNKAKKLKE